MTSMRHDDQGTTIGPDRRGDDPDTTGKGLARRGPRAHEVHEVHEVHVHDTFDAFARADFALGGRRRSSNGRSNSSEPSGSPSRPPIEQTSTASIPPADDPEAFETRVAQLVADHAEPALVKAQDEMGDGRRAVAVAMRWLRPMLGPATGRISDRGRSYRVPLPPTASPQSSGALPC